MGDSGGGGRGGGAAGAVAGEEVAGGAGGIGKFGIRSVLRWLAGDPGLEGALTAMYQREEDFVFKLLIQLGVPNRDADDVLVLTFLRAHRFMLKEREPKKPRGLLCDMAAKEALTYHRNARRGLKTVLSAPPSERPDSTQDPERALRRAEAEQILESALAEMAPDDRTLLQRVDFDGEDYKDVATSMGLKPKTAHSRLSRARDELETRVAERCKKAEQGDKR